MAAITEELVLRGRPHANVADDAPEVSVVEGPAGRETLALITQMARPMRAVQATLDYGDRISNAPGAKTPSRAPAAKASAGPLPAPLVIFEMLTFVVQAADAASLASEQQRRGFVEAHLLQRLPGKDMAQVERVDVTPWTVKGALVVRVWCKVRSASVPEPALDRAPDRVHQRVVDFVAIRCRIDRWVNRHAHDRTRHDARSLGR